MWNVLSGLLSMNALTYHRELPFIIPLYHTTGFSHSLPETRFIYRNRTEIEFETDLDILLKYFTPVDLETLHIYISQKKKTRKPYFHITVDDGLSSNYEIMAPVLLKKGIPATFFINPAFIGDKDLMHRYKASILLDVVENNKSYLSIIADHLGIRTDFNIFRNLILSYKYNNQTKLDELANLIGVTWEQLLNGNSLYMDMSQLGILNENGFSIGAHSWDHPEFYLLSLDDQKDQVLKSLDWVQQYFPQKIRTFAFPFTDHKVSIELFNWLEDKIDISFGTAGLKKDENSRHLQRIPVEKYKDKMEIILKTESLKYWIKKVLNLEIVRH